MIELYGSPKFLSQKQLCWEDFFTIRYYNMKIRKINWVFETIFFPQLGSLGHIHQFSSSLELTK